MAELVITRPTNDSPVSFIIHRIGIIGKLDIGLQVKLRWSPPVAWIMRETAERRMKRRADRWAQLSWQGAGPIIAERPVRAYPSPRWAIGAVG